MSVFFTPNDLTEILQFIPSRPEYSRWIRIISAVSSVLPEDEAVSVLAAWSPEETAGEYHKKLRSPLKNVGIGSLIAMAKENGFDASGFNRGRARMLPASRFNSSIVPRTKAQEKPLWARKLPRYTPRPGTAEELAELAKLRRLGSSVGLAEMQAAGCLAFTDDLNDGEAREWNPVKAWLVLDPSRRNVSARRLDGQVWKCCHGAKSRCISGPGSKSWPVGLTLAKLGQRLDVVEGEGDFVAIWHLHALAKVDNAAPVALLGSCTNLDSVGQEIAPYVAGRAIQLFSHLDANGAGQAAVSKWATSFYRLGAAEVRRRNLAPWLEEGGKDLNDAIANELIRNQVPAPPSILPDQIRGKEETI